MQIILFEESIPKFLDHLLPTDLCDHIAFVCLTFLIYKVRLHGRKDSKIPLSSKFLIHFLRGRERKRNDEGHQMAKALKKDF